MPGAVTDPSSWGRPSLDWAAVRLHRGPFSSWASLRSDACPPILDRPRPVIHLPAAAPAHGAHVALDPLVVAHRARIGGEIGVEVDRGLVLRDREDAHQIGALDLAALREAP